jgi:hypothetical protein
MNSSRDKNYLYQLSNPFETLPINISGNTTPDSKSDLYNEKSLINKSSVDADSSVIDVMVIYTLEAKTWADTSETGIENNIAIAIEKGNLVHENSNTLIKLNLVHSEQVNYTESESSSTDLSRLTFHADYDPWEVEEEPRYLEEVHEWRDTYKADLVAMFTKVDDTGGLSWLLTADIGFSQLGFSITRVQQASWTFTFVHELGHNMGLGHHSQQLVQPGPGLFNYSAGWRWTGDDEGKYCSVMTYKKGIYFDDGIDHARVPYFSNPDITFENTATGDYTSANSARSLREMRNIIEDYRISTSDIDDYTSLTNNYGLINSYPNPFNPIAMITYDLTSTHYNLAEIIVYNSTGQKIWQKELDKSKKQSIQFDGSNFNSGVYYYSLIIDGKSIKRKSMVLIK